MSRPTTPSWYDVFGGLNLESSSEIGNFEAAELTNLYIWNKGQELRRRKGTELVREFPWDALIDGMEWVDIDGTAYLVTVISGTVYDALDGTDPLALGANRFTAGTRAVNGALLNQKLYLGNGVHQNVRFDGSTVKQVMPSQPTAPTATASSTAPTFSGQYKYKVTYTSADGVNSTPSDASNTVNLTNQSVSLTIPVGTSAENIASRKIWRTLTSGTTYYLVGTVTGNITTTFADNTEDADVDLTNELETGNVRFPPCQYMVNHQERLCGIGNTTEDDGPTTLFISNFQEPELCPLVVPLDEVDDPNQGIRIPIASSGTAIGSFGNVLLVWTKSACYRLTGDNPNNWSFDKWLDVGCVSHRTVRQYRNMLFWLGPDGVYLAEGWGNVQRISDAIQDDFLDSIFSSFNQNSHAYLFDQKYFITSISGPCYYFDLRFRTWGKLDPWVWACSAVSQGSGEFQERIYAADDLTATVYQLETGSLDEHVLDGSAIQAVWKSKDKDLGHFGREKRIHRVIAGFRTSSGDATVYLYRGGELLDTFTHDLSSVSRTGSLISQMDERASEGARDEFFAVKVSSSTLADEFRILRAGFHFTLAT